MVAVLHRMADDGGGWKNENTPTKQKSILLIATVNKSTINIQQFLLERRSNVFVLYLFVKKCQ